MWFYNVMKFDEVQSCCDNIESEYHHLKEDEELYVCVETYTHSLSTPYKYFSNIPEENIVQVNDCGYKVISYDDIKDLYPYSDEAGQ